MFSKLFRLLSVLFLPLLITSSAFFSNVIALEAAQMDSNNENNSLGIVVEESNDDINNSKISAAPDLGDDQAFPFIPGFGKNSGKD